MHTQQQHFFARRLGLILLIANVIGAIIYLVRTSLSWAIPQEHGLVPITGEPFIWFAGIVPVVIVFFPLNLIGGAHILLSRKWQNGYFWLSSAAVWFVAVWIDFAHH
jgi:hypothetical protein